MKRKTCILTLAASCAAATLGLAASQATGRAPIQQQGLVRLHPVPSPQEPLDVEGWRTRLSEADLDRREQGFELAVEAARRDPRLEQELQRWALSDDDLGLAWTARLVLRELRQLERSAGPWSSWPGLGRQGWGPAGPGQDPWSALEDMLRDLEGLHGNLGDLLGEVDRGGLVPQPGARSSSSSVQLQITPDGVRCEVTSEEGGRKVTRKLEAATLEELLEQHPELRESVQLALPGEAWHGGPGSGPQRPSTRLARPARTDILGVVIAPLPPERASALGLEPGAGLSVERVEPGTLADALGVQRGQVLVALNGTPLAAREDVTRTLAAREPGDDVVLVLIDQRGQRQTRVWQPQRVEDGPAPPDALLPRRGPRQSFF